MNSGYAVRSPSFFNMSLGFRHDTPASSPYGYTVRLAPQSRRKGLHTHKRGTGLQLPSWTRLSCWARRRSAPGS